MIISAVIALLLGALLLLEYSSALGSLVSALGEEDVVNSVLTGKASTALPIIFAALLYLVLAIGVFAGMFWAFPLGIILNLVMVGWKVYWVASGIELTYVSAAIVVAAILLTVLIVFNRKRFA
jgi:hypothetical protein